MIYTIYFPNYYTPEHNKAMEYLVTNLKGLEYYMEGTDVDKGRFVKMLPHPDYPEAIDALVALQNADCIYLEEEIDD